MGVFAARSKAVIDLALKLIPLLSSQPRSITDVMPTPNYTAWRDRGIHSFIHYTNIIIVSLA